MSKKRDNKKSQTQLGLLMEYFKNNPTRNISHPEIVDWATNEWSKQTGEVFRDPDRGIRQLHQDGYLIKVKKAVYNYNPNNIKKKILKIFLQSKKRKY